MSKEWSPRNLFDVLGDEAARRILALASEERRSAEALADRLDVSQPTVYRRLEVLESYDLVRPNRRVDEDGHHYEAYESNLEAVRLALDDGEVTVDVTRVYDPVETVE